jgi:DNA-binding transcriptional ArsR family regulator
MDNKETNKGLIRSDILLHNEDYFKYIFKKTEKIVSAVFYTTRGLSEEIQKDILVLHVEEKSLSLTILLEKTLGASRTHQVRLLEELRIALIALESALVMLTTGRVLREDLFDVFRHEIGSLQRVLREYTRETGHHPLETPFEIAPRSIARRERATASRERVMGGDAITTNPSPNTPNRRERIMGIIKDKGHVTIKDVSTAITDVSEKTIQRELMSLISDRIIVKEGERRWSKYSIAQ